MDGQEVDATGAQLADLTLSAQSFDGQINSPNDMVVDTDDLAVEPNDADNNDVAVINPDTLGKEGEQSGESGLVASDCASPSCPSMRPPHPRLGLTMACS